MSLGTQAGSGQTQGAAQPRTGQNSISQYVPWLAAFLLGLVILLLWRPWETRAAAKSEAINVVSQDEVNRASQDARIALDYDTDGVPDAFEQGFSDPTMKDTDGDGILDADEYIQYSNGIWVPRVSGGASCSDKRVPDVLDPCVPNANNSACPCGQLAKDYQERSFKNNRVHPCTDCGPKQEAKKGQKSSSRKTKSPPTDAGGKKSNGTWSQKGF